MIPLRVTFSRAAFGFSLLLPCVAANAALEFVWAPEPGLPIRSGTSAVAAAPGRVAFADGGAVWLSDAQEPARRVVLAGAVSALAFEPEGALLVGTEAGLVRWHDGRQERLTLGSGDGARVNRIVASGAAVWVGTDSGLFVRRAFARFERVPGRGLDGAVTALVVVPATERDPETVHAIVAGRWVTRPAAAEGPLGGAVVSGHVGQGTPRDLAVATGAVFCLTERAILRLDAASLRRLPFRLAPGALPSRIAATATHLWVATDRGLLGATQSDPAGATRVTPPLGAAASNDLAVLGADLLVAGARGVWRGRPNGAAATTPPRRVFAPPVSEVKAAVVAYQGLGPGRMRSMAARARRRGFFPELDLRGAYGGGRRRDDESDEVFSSGKVRRLRDRSHDRARDFDLGVVLSFDFRDASMDPEEIDVARETRAWVTLRDEVLDEIHQLYFERCRALAAAAGAPPEERLGHRLRAAELAAGLDGWSGGWWRRRADDFTPDGPLSESQGCDPTSFALPRP
jgi:hypothetical protein